VFVGYGDLADRVRASAARSDSIYFHPAVAPHDVLRYAASADVGLSLIEDTCLSYRLCLPNKVFEYLMAGLPIIVSDLPEMAALVRERGIGAVARSLDPQGIGEAIARVLAMTPTARAANVRETAREFSWEAQEEELVRRYRTHVLKRAAGA
jgi:glycosyltransferase involved in cell wall biosynthesis